MLPWLPSKTHYHNLYAQPPQHWSSASSHPLCISKLASLDPLELTQGWITFYKFLLPNLTCHHMNLCETVRIKTGVFSQAHLDQKFIISWSAEIILLVMIVAKMQQPTCRNSPQKQLCSPTLSTNKGYLPDNKHFSFMPRFTSCIKNINTRAWHFCVKHNIITTAKTLFNTLLLTQSGPYQFKYQVARFP